MNALYRGHNLGLLRRHTADESVELRSKCPARLSKEATGAA